MARLFISYSHLDKSQVERLARELVQAGHDVWLDEWRIEIGDSIIAKLNNGLDLTQHVLLCLSEHLPSSWANREWMSSLARQLNGAPVSVIPILLGDSALPPILADIKYLDLRSNWAEGVQTLLKTFR